MQTQSPFAEPGAVLLPIVFRYSAIVAVAFGTASAGFAIEIDAIKNAFVVFGLVLGVFTFVALLVEAIAKIELHNVHIVNLTNAIMPQEAPKPVAAPTVWNVQRNQVGFTARITNYAERTPSREFIIELYRLASARPNRRVPERAFIDGAFKASANEWLSILEKEHLLEREHSAVNAPRRLASAVTLEAMLAVFGYEVLDAPTALLSPVD